MACMPATTTSHGVLGTGGKLNQSCCPRWPRWVPRHRRASCMSLGLIVDRFAWMAQRLVSSKTWVKYISAASCTHKAEGLRQWVELPTQLCAHAANACTHPCTHHAWCKAQAACQWVSTWGCMQPWGHPMAWLWGAKHSCNASNAVVCQRFSPAAGLELYSWAISLTSLANGAFLINKSAPL